MNHGQTERYLLPGRGKEKKVNVLDVGSDERQEPIHRQIREGGEAIRRLLRAMKGRDLAEVISHLGSATRALVFYRLGPVGLYLLPAHEDFEGVCLDSHAVVLMANSGEGSVTFIVFALDDKGELDYAWGCTRGIALSDHPDKFYARLRERINEGLAHLGNLADSIEGGTRARR